MLYDYTEMQFTDELLGKEVLPQHVERAEQGLYAFAKRLGVPQGDVIRSYLADELVQLYTYRFVCFDKAYALPVLTQGTVRQMISTVRNYCILTNVLRF